MKDSDIPQQSIAVWLASKKATRLGQNACLIFNDKVAGQLYAYLDTGGYGWVKPCLVPKMSNNNEQAARNMSGPPTVNHLQDGKHEKRA